MRKLEDIVTNAGPVIVARGDTIVTYNGGRTFSIWERAFGSFYREIDTWQCDNDPSYWSIGWLVAYCNAHLDAL